MMMILGQTKIRPHEYENPLTTKKIITYDAVQLYTAAMCEELPVSIFALRNADDNFRPLLGGSQRGMDAMLWLEYQSLKDQIPIQHKGNNVEARITVKIDNQTKVISVDGYCRDVHPHRVYEYVPCSFHSLVIIIIIIK